MYCCRQEDFKRNKAVVIHTPLSYYSRMQVIILGSGTSHGIPVIGCSCKVCQSDDPRDHRSRASILVRNNDSSILIDTSTEFRLQAVRNNIHKLDAVFYTHAHADHLHGLDDIRPLTMKKPAQVYATESTSAEIRKRFDYIFKNTQKGGGKPQINLNPLPADGVCIDGLQIIPVPLFHGELNIVGYRMGNIAYLTDCSRIPGESYQMLENLEILILGALRYRPHPTHFCFEQAIEAAERIGARRTFFTHLCHDASHQELLDFLPKKIEPAFDGLCLDL